LNQQTSQQHLMMSPDPPILAKNNKAMAQLAPLDHNPISNTSVFNTPGSVTGGGGAGVKIPSLETLQH
jgi:hypothetical protein